MDIKVWIEAFRLRTLPLAFSCIFMGTFLAAYVNRFCSDILLMALLTTLLLQILSNLANDYGDNQNGADNADRVGPKRAVQSGAISPSSMKAGIIVTSVLSLLSGLGLLYIAFGEINMDYFLFVAIGLACIAAAIKYTAGKNPYGYSGLGDISVFVFFGLVGVAGAYFLYTKELSWFILLPASASGLYAVAVLNLNNMRDIENDKVAGKMTIPARAGFHKALLYHRFLLLSGPVLLTVFTCYHFKSYIQFIFLIVCPLVIKQLNALNRIKNLRDIDPLLKMQALTTLLMVLLFGLGLLLPGYL